MTNFYGINYITVNINHWECKEKQSNETLMFLSDIVRQEVRLVESMNTPRVT